MVLGEACCFHGNQSEINLAMVREELKEKKERRKKERKKINNWYLLLDAWSSWPTTVLSTLAGLLILSYYDRAKSRNLYPQLHGQLQPTENKFG